MFTGSYHPRKTNLYRAVPYTIQVYTFKNLGGGYAMQTFPKKKVI